MKRKLTSLVAAVLMVPALALGVSMSLPQTANAKNCDTDSVLGGAKCARTGEQKGDIGNVIQDITNVLLFIIGAVAVIMIIVGGIRYTISNGDSSQITAAKNTILYGVIGVIVALLAFAIVNFVVGAFTTSPSRNATLVTE